MMRQFLALFVVALFAVSGARAEQDLYNPLAVGLRWDVDVEMTTPGGGHSEWERGARDPWDENDQ